MSAPVVSGPRNEVLSPRAAVAAMLAQSLGQQKATDVVNAAADELRMGAALDHASVQKLLEHVAQQPGIVGVAARFAKSRHLLKTAS